MIAIVSWYNGIRLFTGLKARITMFNNLVLWGKNLRFKKEKKIKSI